MFSTLFKTLAVVSIALTVTACSVSDSEPLKIKVMSYNIRHGADMQYKMNLDKQA